MKAMWVLLVVCVVACCGANHEGVTDVTPDTVPPDDTVDVAVEVATSDTDTKSLDTTCIPNCAGKECADDGCGGSCGTCPKGETCEDGWCQGGGCEPTCSWQDECGADGCGGVCGLCGEGVECHGTKFGWRCTIPCELFTCPAGEICLFGYCFDQECTEDEDCGDGPETYCDEFLQCRKRSACETSEDCWGWKKKGYCDPNTMLCVYDGHCWDDGDCPGGTCDADHWCRGHTCYDLWSDEGPGCPPDEPICELPSGERPRCDGGICSSCVAPCVFDHECPEDTLCKGSQCWTLGNDCDLDSECDEGSYCHPGCSPLKPACETEADCGGTLCLVGFCTGDQVVECDSDAACEAWDEGVSCQDGVCKPVDACVIDSQCGPGEYCAHVCQPLPELPECKVDADCTEGQVCQSETCADPPECIYDVQCPVGHVCEEQRCYNDQGVCAWLEKGPGFCDDGDPCTDDSCDAEQGCLHSRYAVGWMVATRETAALARQLIKETYLKQGVNPGELTIHADRGSPMKAKSTALLMADLGVTKSHSRPHVSDDNPFSESQFKTLKYRPEFPARFGSSSYQ